MPVSRLETTPDRTDEPAGLTDATGVTGVTPAWIGGVVLAGVGTGLSVIALTLPWISVRIERTSPVTLPVTDVARQGPIFALLLVVTALLAVVGFSTARRGSDRVRYLAVVIGAMPAVVSLFLGLRPSTEALRAALPEGQIEYWDQLTESGAKDLPVSAMSGLALYVAGLLVIGLGVAIASFGSAGRVTVIFNPGQAMSARRRLLTRWVALGAAVPLIVLSLALTWFEVVTTDQEMPAVVQGWQSVYRVGLIAVLIVLLGASLTVGNTQRLLRAIGLYLGGGLIATLSVNVLLLWDPSGLTREISVELESLSLGPAYLAAIVAVPLLQVVFWTITPADVSS
jgi:hypothetical protein